MIKFLLLFLLSFNIFSNDRYINDYQNKVSKKFKISKYYRPAVNFWFDIYTKYPSSVSVIHDKKIYGLVYGSSSKEKFFKRKLLRQLDNIKKNYFSEKKLSKLINKHILLPKNKLRRSKIISKLIKNIRGQRGQKDMIENGLIRFSKFEHYLLKLIREFQLPKELLAISFLESSFNPLARSKASAAGAWQFMPLIASYFLPKRTNYVDYRYNIILSSIAAFHLLKQNIQILKTYDLAVTAYNSGTKSLLKAKRSNSKASSLEYIIKNVKGRNFGYASKNFYSEFLALTRVLAYKNELFKKIPKSKKLDYYVYTSNCSFNSKAIINKDLNSHIFSFNKRYKSGTLFVSRSNFTSSRFKKIHFKKFKKNYPKFFSKRFKSRCL